MQAISNQWQYHIFTNDLLVCSPQTSAKYSGVTQNSTAICCI